MTDAASSLDLNLLRYLVTLVQESSVTRAAERLEVSQPAVSAALKRLRETFQDPILVRSGHGMSPTPRAVLMAEQVAPLLDGVRHMVEGRGRFEPSNGPRTFTLMGSDYIQFMVLPRLFTVFQQQRAQVVLEHRPANPSKVEPWLESGQVDLGIGYLAAPALSLRTRLLFGDKQVCLMRKSHPYAMRPLTLDAYSAMGHVAVSPSGAGIYGARVDSLLRTLGVRRRFVVTLPSFLAMPYLIARTDLIATVPGRLATYFAGLLPLAIVDPPVPLPSFEMYMFWHERAHQDQSNAWLRQQVVDAVRDLL